MKQLFENRCRQDKIAKKKACRANALIRSSIARAIQNLALSRVPFLGRAGGNSCKQQRFLAYSKRKAADWPTARSGSTRMFAASSPPYHSSLPPLTAPFQAGSPNSEHCSLYLSCEPQAHEFEDGVPVATGGKWVRRGKWHFQFRLTSSENKTICMKEALADHVGCLDISFNRAPVYMPRIRLILHTIDWPVSDVCEQDG